MGEMKEHPRYNVISLRFSDIEMELLEEMTLKTNLSRSDLMRDAFLFFTDEYRKSRSSRRAA
jgi:hypothetical protein